MVEKEKIFLPKSYFLLMVFKDRDETDLQGHFLGISQRITGPLAGELYDVVSGESVSPLSRSFASEVQ